MSKRSFYFRALILSAVLVPGAAVMSIGCDSSTQYDDLCGWLRDPKSCYREYFIDIGARCGAADMKPGQFLDRNKLDTCIIDGGGQVVFEPPLNLDQEIGSNPEGMKFKFVNPDSTTCGEATFSAKYAFTLKITPDTVADDGELPESAVEGGTFILAGGKDTDTLDATCPNGGGSFTFDRLQVTRCDQVEDLIPHAELDFNPGGVEATGIISFRIYFPPQEGDLEGAAPVPVTYFNCVIPAAPPPCMNATRDGSETDIDCGGSFCAARCQDGQNCITDDDCASDDCGLVMGIKQCIGP